MSEAIKVKFEEELSKFKQLEKDREKYISNRQQLESQLTENKMVKTELDLLDENDKVFKLIGAVLVRQELAEARANVEKRIEYITQESKRVEDSLIESAEKQKSQKDKLMAIQEQFKKIAGPGAQ